MDKFPNLFQTLKINKYTYKNRIVSAPMVFGAVFQFEEAAARAYRKIEAAAKGGAAAVIVGETSVNYTDAERIPFRPIDYARYSGPDFEGFKKYADLIKKHGSVALVELFHAGGEKDPLPGQPNPRGPSGYRRKNGVVVEEMNREMMDKACEDFATAAAFMKTAGFNGILTHSGHGWLFSQFLSPLFNKRTDNYGGNLENRARFLIEIFQSIRKLVGPDFIIEARINGRDGVTGGIEADDVGRFCCMIENIVDSVHISAGLYNNPVVTNQFSSMFAEHGCNTGLSAIVKKHTKLPVGVVGGINAPELAETIIAEGQADFVVLARQMIADPELPNKASSGRETEIRSCLRCYTCFPGSPEAGYDTALDDGTPLMLKVGSCTINPKANYPVALDEIPEPNGKRNVLIIGGGVAGMQAAITAVDRGHKVTLAEKNTKLGGILSLFDTDVDKKDLMRFKDLLIRETLLRKVVIKLNTEVTPGFIRDMNPDTVIFALGSSPIKPAIPGIENAIRALDVYDASKYIGKNVVMIGGGLVGCETALHLAKTGHRVVIIELLKRLANESFGMYREALMLEMEKLGIIGKIKTRCYEITTKGVCVANDSDAREFIGADTIVYALGMKPNSTAVLRDAAGKLQILEAGDCIKPAKVGDAVKGGFVAAMSIL